MTRRPLASFEWSLEWPAVMLTLKHGESLSSPIFYAEESRTTEFYLRIDRGDTNYTDCNIVTSIYLCRCDKDGPNNVEIKYELSIMPNYIKRTFKQVCVKPQSGDLYDCNKLNSLQISGKISMNKWIVVCRILSYDAGKSANFEYADRDDLVCLSDDLTKMLNNSLFSDGVIQITKRAFKIHKAILAVRCPALLNKKQARSLLESYSGKSIKMILHYLYSGKLNPTEIPEELYNLLKSDDLHVRHLIASFPLLTCAETRFTGISFSFNWEIQNFLKRSIDKDCIYTITESDVFSWFTFRFFLNKQEKDKYLLEFLVERVKQKGCVSSRSDIFVRCLLDARFSGGSVENIASENVLDSCHYFYNEDIWKISLKNLWERISQIQDNKIDDLFKMNISIEFLVKFSICDGERTTSIKCSNVQSNSNSLCFKALNGLGQDMKKLFENPVYCDFSLKVRERTFQLHKGILSARSPNFRRIFQDKKRKNLKSYSIESLEEKVASSIISYIYTAQINDDLDVDLAMKLYNAAETYEIKLLRIKCEKFLALSLNAANIDQIESFANEVHSTDLKKSVHDFKSEFQRNN